MTESDLIERAIESAKCRLYKVKVRDSYSIDHQRKAENQTELMNITIEALEKQIPKKPTEVEEKESGFGYSIAFICPSCGTAEVYRHYKPNNCLHCGQALDWSEEE